MKEFVLSELGSDEIEALCQRKQIDFKPVFEVVRGVLDDVRKNGDEAVRAYTEKFDGVELDSFLVDEREIEEACGRVEDTVKVDFETAARNIENFHRAQLSENIKIETMRGVMCFNRILPIEKVGLYIPGGTAPLPSTVLMLGIPAKIAGCKEVVMCTPPNREGKIPDIILYTAKLAGIRKIFRIGGAQAIAAMGYGTETVPKVYKVFGPGNQYVTAAKMLLSIDPSGAAMDMPAGPSEVLVIADSSVRADFVAADLLSQAEHGKDSQVVLVCTSKAKIEEIIQEIRVQLAELDRKEIAEKALENSFALEVPDVDAALKFSNQYAPEHLILNIKNADRYIDSIANAGSVFIGKYSCESAGDYASGTNHTLPTYGCARAYSGIGVDSFMKRITFQKLTKRGAKEIGSVVETMAGIEGLGAHKNAMTLRLKND
jgi:histidinol dehydrogenase